MPYNGSGSFTILNLFVPNTTILSASVNQNFTDIATGLSDCLTRDGQAGMTAIFKAVSGSVSAPGISFNNDATSGLYLSASGIPGFVAHSLGILLNTTLFCAISATVSAGGSGYAVGDTITPAGTGIAGPVFQVATLSGSAVATVTLLYSGWLTVKPTNPVAQFVSSGIGTGCTLNITFNDPTSADYRALITTEASALPWVRFGSSSYISGLMSSANAYTMLTALVTIGAGLSLNTTTNPPTVTTTTNPTLIPNYISGFTMSTAGSSGTMTIAAGVANDSTNTVLMKLSSSISKTTASWAVGTGNGGLDTGAIANSTWYHFYEIERVDTGVVDVIFSLSASAPTLPTNYTIYRRIGSRKTNGSAQWILFTQTGNTVIWSATVTDVNAGNNNGARTSVTLTVPTGIVVKALFRAGTVTGSSGTMATMFSSLVGESDQAPSAVFASLSVVASSQAAGDFQIITSTTAQIGFRTSSTFGTTSINTYGWIDDRGA